MNPRRPTFHQLTSPQLYNISQTKWSTFFTSSTFPLSQSSYQGRLSVGLLLIYDNFSWFPLFNSPRTAALPFCITSRPQKYFSTINKRIICNHHSRQNMLSKCKIIWMDFNRHSATRTISLPTLVGWHIPLTLLPSPPCWRSLRWLRLVLYRAQLWLFTLEDAH